MARYDVVISQEAQTDLRQILLNSIPVYDLEFATGYILEISQLCDTLKEYPEWYSFDNFTKNPEIYRSFSYKSHKVFYRVDHELEVVHIVMITHARAHYSDQI